MTSHLFRPFFQRPQPSSSTSLRRLPHSPLRHPRAIFKFFPHSLPSSPARVPWLAQCPWHLSLLQNLPLPFAILLVIACPLCLMSHGSSRDSVSVRFQLRVSVLPYPFETLTSTAAVCASSDTSHTIPSSFFPRILQPDVLVLPSNAFDRDYHCHHLMSVSTSVIGSSLVTFLGSTKKKGDLPDACRLQQLEQLCDTVYTNSPTSLIGSLGCIISVPAAVSALT